MGPRSCTIQASQAGVSFRPRWSRLNLSQSAYSEDHKVSYRAITCSARKSEYDRALLCPSCPLPDLAQVAISTCDLLAVQGGTSKSPKP